MNTLLLTLLFAVDFAIPGQPSVVKLEWNDHNTTDLVEGFVVLRSADPRVTMADVITTVTRQESLVSTDTVTSVTHHLWLDRSVKPGAVYHYRVASFRRGEYSVVSLPSSIRTKGYRPQIPPRRVRATD